MAFSLGIILVSIMCCERKYYVNEPKPENHSNVIKLRNIPPELIQKKMILITTVFSDRFSAGN